MAQRYDPERHHRRSTRLPGWDYRSQAYYFVTICTHDRQQLFDSPVLAAIAADRWRQVPNLPHARGVTLDEWILMPNHLHALLLLPGMDQADAETGDIEAVMPGLPFDMRYAAGRPVVHETDDRPALPAGSLGAIIGSYKSGVTRRINALQRCPGCRVWQRGYYEHIVRNNYELDRIRAYIRENPARWAEDRDNLDSVLARMMHVANM